MTSTTAPTETARTGYRLLRRLPLLALILAIVAVMLLALGPLGWRAGWWHYRVGFSYLMPWAAYCGLAAVGVAILALVIGFRVNAGRHIAIGVIAFIIGAVIAYVPWHYSQMRDAVPPIHDITTDAFDPPVFVALAAERALAPNGLKYGGMEVAAQQQKAYPDIKSLIVKTAPAETVQRAIDAARSEGWQIVASDAPSGRIEATDTTRWFGFKDDIVVRVRPEGSGSRVDVRSVSRVGKSDIGANAKRVRGFLARLA